MLSILKRANEQVAENPSITNFKISSNVFLEDIQSKSTAGLDTIVKQLNKHLKTLMIQFFEWGTEEEPECCIFMQQIKVTKEEVTFTFSNYIRDHIKPISNALIIKDFALIQSFRSEYARQLYKHLMMWEKRQACYLTVQDFKDFLGVPKTKSYEQMTNLKTKVLNVAVNEINEKCPWMDLKCTNRKLPRSKTIEGFNFGWFAKPREEAKDNQRTFKETLIDEELMKYIGKTIYQNGYDWRIVSISKNKNLYSIFCHEETDKSYTKTFEVSEVQLRATK
jgi:plasmid replication initiation protein